MRTGAISIILSLVPSVRPVAQILLPELTGPHAIGLTHLELIDYARPDPLGDGSSSEPRDLMVTLLYPTIDSSTFSSTLAPQFSPATATFIDELLDLTPGTAVSLTTRARLDLPIANPDTSPVVLFSHGFGFTRGLYTALLSDLASWGWIVVAIDHPHDAGLVEYPDGRIVRAGDWSWPLDADLREMLLELRVADILFVFEQLGDSATMNRLLSMNEGTAAQVALKAQCPLPGPSLPALNVSSVAALGHSFGGAAAVQAMTNLSAIVAAADLDGFLYGPVVRSGTDKAVCVLGFPEHFATDDPDAAPGWPGLKGWKRDFTVTGTVHESFSDYAVFADLLGNQGPDVGTVKGTRMVEILRTYVGAFFSKFMLGIDDGEFLNDSSTEFTEVSLRRSS
ncbi:hypothetical protein F5Y15DRAFT_320891 [Xylariaceae sp. FL0016]|nr:hypothetical protein F5Y15DRAFT_320891 [Xylariaceae sp. FL0016]